MSKISTFVFCDVEATGLAGPGDRPRITEISMVAVHRDELLDSIPACLPRVLDKLTLCIQPLKSIPFAVSQMTGLYNDSLSRQKDFDKSLATMICLFLKRHHPPVCLVAHNGLSYDFGLLQVELASVGCSLPNDIFCLDSLQLFRSLDSSTIHDEGHCALINSCSAVKSFTHEKQNQRRHKELSVKRKLFPDDVPSEDDYKSGLKKRTCLSESPPPEPEKSTRETTSVVHADIPGSLRLVTESKSLENISDYSHEAALCESSDSTRSIRSDTCLESEDHQSKLCDSNKSNAAVNLDSQATVPYWEGSLEEQREENSAYSVEILGESCSMENIRHSISDSVLAEIDLTEIPMLAESHVSDGPAKAAANTGANESVVLPETVVSVACMETGWKPPETDSKDFQTHKTKKIRSSSEESDAIENCCKRRDQRTRCYHTDTKVDGLSASTSTSEKSNSSASGSLNADPNVAIRKGTNTSSTNKYAYQTPLNKVGRQSSSVTPTKWSPVAGRFTDATSNPSLSSSKNKVSYRLEEIYYRLVGCYPSSSHRAEDDALALVRIFQAAGEKAISMGDKIAVPMTKVSPLYTARPRKPLPDKKFSF